MPRTNRIEAIRAFSEYRGGSNVLVYVTSTREKLEAQMAMDATSFFYDHLRSDEFVAGKPIDLVIHSNGGNVVVPWRLMSLLREFADTVNVVVPHLAYSAATLTALGADQIVMGPMGVLGPTDPSTTTPFNPDDPANPPNKLPISVEDVAAYIALVKDDVGIRHEDELVQAFALLANKDTVHPIALGNVKRSTSQARLVGEKLLKLRGDDLDEHRIREIIDSLSSKIYFHGHPISRREARNDLGLKVAEPDETTDELLWELFLLYEAEMKLNEPFNQFTDAQRQPGYNLNLPNPPQFVPPNQLTPAIPNVYEHQIGPETLVMLESLGHADRYEITFSSVIVRMWDGEMKGRLTLADQAWRREV